MITWILQVIEAALTYEQYEVLAIQTCKDFFGMVEKFRPHLILLDYRLSDGDGGVLCQQLKMHPDFRQLPVVICSAYVRQGLDLKAYGCDAVILKPIDLEELLNTIMRLTSGEKLISENHDQLSSSIGKIK